MYTNIKSQISSLKFQKLRVKVLFIFVAILFFFFTSYTSSVNAATGINKQINFQGKLTNSAGVNVTDGSYTVVFTLYDAASNGTTLWTETDSVTTVAGIFQVALGANTSFPGNVNFNQDNLYLDIKVGADSEIAPRVRFTAVPYAFSTVDIQVS